MLNFKDHIFEQNIYANNFKMEAQINLSISSKHGVYVLILILNDHFFNVVFLLLFVGVNKIKIIEYLQIATS